MPISTVTPADLNRALLDARRRGGPSDYYGLGAALGNFGSAYKNIAGDLNSANDAIRNNEVTNAQLSSGYYPLNQEVVNTDLRNRVYGNQQQMAVKQAIEEAHRAAVAQGFTAGTPQYQLFMRDSLSKHGPYNAAMGAVPGADKAMTRMQQEQVAKAFIKKSMENYAVNEMARVRLEQLKQMPEVTPADYPRLEQQAKAEAQQKIGSDSFEIEFASDGQIVAHGKYGKDVPINPQVLSSAVAMMGDTGPMKVLKDLTDAFLKNRATERADLLASEAAAKGAVTAKGGISDRTGAAGAGKTPPDLDRAALHKRLDVLYAQRASLGKNKENMDSATATWLEDKIKQYEDQLYGSPNKVTVDSGQRAGMGAGGGAAAVGGTSWTAPNDFEPPSTSMDQIPVTNDDFGDLYTGASASVPTSVTANTATAPDLSARLNLEGVDPVVRAAWQRQLLDLTRRRDLKLGLPVRTMLPGSWGYDPGMEDIDVLTARTP